MKIQILMEFENELGLEYIKSLLKEGIDIDSILVIGDVPNKHRQKLVEERTGGLYQHKNFLYAIGNHSIPLVLFDKVNSPYLEKYMKKHKADLVISSITKIIKVPIFDIPTIGVINCHAGLLPKYRGCSCLEWAVYNDDTIGATVYFMEKDVDSGKIIVKKSLQYLPNDTYYKVRYRMIFHMSNLVVEAVKKIEKGFTKKDGLVFPKGTYYSPMDNEKLQIVKEKIRKLC